MNKNHHLWVISMLATVVAVGGVATWLWLQYAAARQQAAEQFCQVCDDCYRQEAAQREAEWPADEQPYVIEKMSGHGQVAADSLSRLFSEQGRRFVVVDLSGVPAEHAQSNIGSVFVVSEWKPFQPQALATLLRSHGYTLSSPVSVFATPDTVYTPTYTLHGTSLHVLYPHNPLARQVSQFDVDLPLSAILGAMRTQMAVAALVLLFFAALLFYLQRTISRQQRLNEQQREHILQLLDERQQLLLEAARHESQPAAPAPAPAASPAGTPTSDKAIMVGQTRFDFVLNKLHYDGEVHNITSRQADLLYILMQTPGQLVPHANLLLPIWGVDSEQNRQALNVQISYLRQALIADRTVNIKNIKGKGYVIVTDNPIQPTE